MLSLISSASAMTHLIPIPEDRIYIDGTFQDWGNIPLFSSEYYVKGEQASRTDLKGQVGIAISEKSLYLIAHSRDDDVSLSKRTGDMMMFVIMNKKRRYEVRVDLKPLAQNRPLKLTLNRRRVKGAEIAGRVEYMDSTDIDSTQGALNLKDKSVRQENTGSSSKTQEYQSKLRRGSWHIELRIPLSAFKQIYGSKIKFAGIFFDFDNGLQESVYSTHFVNKSLTPSIESFVLGGNIVFRYLYENLKNKPLRSLHSLTVNWIGDRKKEEIHFTSNEIIVFGAHLSSNKGYTDVVHGWGEAPKVVTAKLQKMGDGKSKTLWVVHTETHLDADNKEYTLHILELYRIGKEGLEKRFAQVIQIDLKTGERLKAKVQLERGGKHIIIHPVSLPNTLSHLENKVFDYPSEVNSLSFSSNSSTPVRYILKRTGWRTTRTSR